MKNCEIRDLLQSLTAEERRITREILELLLRAMEQRSWLEFGFGSLFDWLARGFGYSAAAAMRRIEAARLLKAVPEAKARLEEATLPPCQIPTKAGPRLWSDARSTLNAL